MFPNSLVISYFSQVILLYLSCRKKQAVIVLLSIAAVIKGSAVGTWVWDAMVNKAKQTVSHSTLYCSPAAI